MSKSAKTFSILPVLRIFRTKLRRNCNKSRSLFFWACCTRVALCSLFARLFSSLFARVVPVDSMLSCNNNVTSASYNTKSNSYRILISYSTHDALHWNVALMSPELRIQLTEGGHLTPLLLGYGEDRLSPCRFLGQRIDISLHNRYLATPYVAQRRGRGNSRPETADLADYHRKSDAQTSEPRCNRPPAHLWRGAG